MEILGLVDKKNIFMLLGCYCNNPRLILDKKYETNSHDYNENFHKTVWGAICNIAKKSNVNKITSIEIENELSQFQIALNLWKVNDGWSYVERAIEETEDKIYNINLYHDTVRKFSMLRMAKEKMKMDISFLYNESDESILAQFNQMDSKQVLRSIYNRFDEFKGLWKSNFGDNYNFHAGEGLGELIDKCKNQVESFGFPFQNQFLNTIFRGMKEKKYLVFSSKTGGGKSRLMMGEAMNIASDKMYDWKINKWIPLGKKRGVLYISTELIAEEIQTCLLAHVSGIDEDRIIEWKDITEYEYTILIESQEVIKDSLLYVEYITDCTIDLITETIERKIINESVAYVFYDYLNESPSLLSSYVQKAGVKSLQTHQILSLFSEALKLLTNRYSIHLRTATQVSSNYKDERDSNAIRGSKAIADKCDGGAICLPATASDLQKLKPILESSFYSTPNYATFIYKNRGHKWNNIIVWSKVDLSTCREEGLFCTNDSYELISAIKKTKIEIEEFNVETQDLIDEDLKETTSDFIQTFNKVTIDNN